MDSHRKKLLEQNPEKVNKKTPIIVLLIVWSIALAAHFIRADKQSSLDNYNTDYFIENAIHQHEDCGFTGKASKTFINYELLWAALNDNWNFEFYITADWQWYFIDQRWNLSSSCSFEKLPIIITLNESRHWYYVSNYYTINSWSSRELYVKSMFSDIAYKNWRQKEHWWKYTKISFLQDAEEYFWVVLDEEWEFHCKFCDKNRYFYEKIQNKEWEDRNLYGSKEIGNQSFIFYSDWRLERIWINGTSYYSWHFWNNASTLLIKDDKKPYTIERFIIEELKDQEMVGFTEYIQI